MNTFFNTKRVRSLAKVLAVLTIACLGSSGGVVHAQAPFKRIKEGQTKGEVLFELGRPMESYGDGTADTWIYANRKGEKCKVRFEERGTRVGKDGVQCEEPEEDRKPAFIGQGQGYDWEARETNRAQRLEVYCGRRPNPQPGCQIDRCDAGVWYQKCPEKKYKDD
jgi:hypothetical protein